MDTSIITNLLPDTSAISFDTNTVLYILMGLFALVCIVIATQKKNKSNKIAVTKVNSGKWVLRADRLYSSIPFLSKYYQKIYRNVHQNYPASVFAIKRRAVQTATRGFGTFVIAIIFVCIVAKGDILFLLTGFLTSFILMTNMINDKFTKQEMQILSQMQKFLEVLRYHYNECNKVDDAMERAMAESPKEITLHIQQIYDVITDVDIDVASEEYATKSHNRFFLLLCSICSTITKQGDRPLPEGVTVFLNSIKHLQEELNVEIAKKRMIKRAFSMISIFCLVPVFIMKPFEIMFVSSQPDLAKYYNGAYGTAVMFLVFFLTLVGNMIIENLKDGRIVENKNLWKKISELPFVRTYIGKKISKNFSKAKKIQYSLKRVGSSISVSMFYAEKLTSAIAVMLLFTVVIFSVDFKEKQTLLNDFTEVFSADYAIDETYIEDLKEFAQNEVELNIREKGLTEEEISQSILDDLVSEGTVAKASEAKAIADSLAKRVTDYNNIYFRFYYILIMYALGVIGYMIPDFVLRSRYKAMEMEMEDEITQFQSIALIMMHIKESTVEDTLVWMEKFSRCFKNSITTCITNLDSGEEDALNDLKEKETAPQFHKIINSLINVDKVGFEAAFDSLETERKFLTEKRSEDNKEVIKKKSKKAWAIVYVILFAVIGLWVIGPMLMMSSSMSDQIMNVF